MPFKHSFVLIALVAFALTWPVCNAAAAGAIQESVTSGNPTNAWTGVSGGTSLYRVDIYNASATVNAYAWIFDSSTNQIDGTRTNLTLFLVASNSTVFYDPPGGERCTKGVTVMQSTTPIQLTNAPPASSQFIIWVKHNRS